MYHPEQLIKPKKLFTLRPGTLEGIVEVIGNEDDDNYEGHYTNRMAMSPAVYKTFATLTERLYRYGLGRAAPNPMEFEYDIHESDVPQGWTQRGDDWHADTALDSIIIVATNNIPTHFLTPGPHSQQDEREAILNLPGPGHHSELTRFNSEAIEEAVNDGVFNIYQPKPNEVVMFSGYTVHRSPTNETGEDISRIFLRTGLRTDI
jgi:hypothetical protein